jgi:hypothetical protein
MKFTEFVTVAVGSAVALVGFAGAALASATIDLIWIDVSGTNAMGNPICLKPENRNCPPDPRSPDNGVTISSVATSDNITLGVILTAGPGGSVGAGVSVNYGDALPMLTVVEFRSLETTEPVVSLPFHLGTTYNDPIEWVQNINAASLPPGGRGIGLSAGSSAYLGTVTFHKELLLVNGIFEIGVGVDGPGATNPPPGPTDDVLDGVGNTISSTTTFNSAFLATVGGPLGCTDSQGNFMQLEVNALRAGGKRVSTGPNQTVGVTAKARILKGTAVSGTTIDTTLTIDAVDGTGVVDTKTSFPITLGVGRGGTGDKLTLNTTRCDGGFITFVATFSGADEDGDPCEGTRQLRKECK